MYDFSWLDKDKEVYVLQNRKFRKSGHFYIGGTLGKSVNGAFIDSYEGNLLMGYFFKENWGLEISYTKAEGTKNNTSKSVEAQSATPFFRKVDTSTAAMITWAPFYSKINTFNKIFYYDWMFGLGAATVSTIDNRNQFSSATSSAFDETKESLSGVAWMTAIRIYITPNWSSRIDFRATHVNADAAIEDEFDTKKRWSHYYNFNLGLNYTF